MGCANNASKSIASMNRHDAAEIVLLRASKAAQSSALNSSTGAETAGAATSEAAGAAGLATGGGMGSGEARRSWSSTAAGAPRFLVALLPLSPFAKSLGLVVAVDSAGAGTAATPPAMQFCLLIDPQTMHRSNPQHWHLWTYRPLEHGRAHPSQGTDVPACF